MKRRQFIIGGAAAAWPLSARAQQSSNKIPVVGVLWHAGSAEEEDVYLSVLVKAFHDLGYDEGRNIHFDHRFPNENPDRFRTLAQELVGLRPDAIITTNTLGTADVKRVTATIPIVFALSADPVGDGFVESLNHPGGNATGLSLMLKDLSGKRLELLKEAVPNLSRVALLIDPTVRSRENTIKAHQSAAQALGLSLWPVEIEGTASHLAEERCCLSCGHRSARRFCHASCRPSPLEPRMCRLGCSYHTDRTSPISSAVQWPTSTKY